MARKPPPQPPSLSPSEAIAEAAAASKPSVADTVSALEQAKSDIAVALGVETQRRRRPNPWRPKPSPKQNRKRPKPPSSYVVEEKVIRGRPARVLSDGTVEAETDEGWMRFENLEHLDEYLEAMVPEA